MTIIQYIMHEENIKMHNTILPLCQFIHSIAKGAWIAPSDLGAYFQHFTKGTNDV